MGFDIRSKPKTLDSKPTSCSELPIWNYDGSSTGQAPGADSEVLLRPVAIFDDPFRGGDNVLVLCETLTPAMEPIPTNTRAAAYGEGNERRLTGAHETAPITEFSYGVANRGASVRIPRTAEASCCGYFEDR